MVVQLEDSEMQDKSLSFVKRHTLYISQSHEAQIKGAGSSIET